ncbi:MAG: right-handed parallel beta-helix repeat-containing protein [Saccharofermentanales bacterium]
MDFIIKTPDPEGAVLVDANEFGLSEASFDNTLALNEALDHCRQFDKSELNIKKGVYRFDNTQKLNIHDIDDFTFNANDSEFIFKKSSYFVINNCNQIMIHDLIIDWDWDNERIADLGRVVYCDPENRFVEIDFIEVEEANENFPWYSLNQFDETALTPGVENGNHYVFGTCKILKVEKTDRKSVLRAYPEKGSLQGIKEGEIYLIQHIRGPAPVFHVNDSTHVTFEDVIIYSASCAGYIITGDTHHYRINRCLIGLRPGTNRRMSSAADAIHVASSQGFCIIENCDFSFMGDDAVNIHDCIGLLDEIISSHEILASVSPHFKIGDVCELRKSDFGPGSLFLTVTGFSKNPEGKHVITFKETIPESTDPDSIIINTRYNSANYIIRNNYFHENRSRGLLLQNDNGLVENNRFYKTQAPAIYVMLEILKGLWAEGTGAQNIVIKGNTFEQCNIADWFSILDIRCELFSNWEKAIIPANLRNEKHNPFPIFRNIEITGNKFIDFPGYVFYIYTAENVTIENNHFSSNMKRNAINPNCGSVFVHSSKNIKIINNISILSQSLANPLAVQSNYSESVYTENNIANEGES